MADDSNGGDKSLHIDTDWKAQARAEKQRLAEQSRQAAQAGGPGGGAAAGGAAAATAAAGAQQQREIPPANVQTLVAQMVTQAMFALGMIPDPQTGRRVAMLDLARHHIDMLGVLEDKCQGNLDEDERKLLASSAYELRMQYVQVSQQALAQQTGRAEADTQG